MDPVNRVLYITRNQLRDLGIPLEEFNDIVMGEEVDPNVVLQAIAKQFNSLSLQLDKFTGDSTLKVEDWVKDFEGYCADVGREAAESKLRCLVTHLGGSARQWYRLQEQGTQDSYDLLIAALKDRFDARKNKCKEKAELYTLAQESGQAFREFLQLVQQRAHGLNLSEEEVVKIAVNGAHANIRGMLKTSAVTTITDLLKLPILADDDTSPSSKLGAEVMALMTEQLSSFKEAICAAVQPITSDGGQRPMPQAARPRQNQQDTGERARTYDRRNDQRRGRFQGNSQEAGQGRDYSRDRKQQQNWQQQPQQQQQQQQQDWYQHQQQQHQQQQQQQRSYSGHRPQQSSTTEQRYRSPTPHRQPQACRKCSLKSCAGDSNCYAYNRQCFACDRFGHLAKCCYSRQYQK